MMKTKEVCQSGNTRYPGISRIRGYPRIPGWTLAGENLKCKIDAPPPFPTNFRYMILKNVDISNFSPGKKKIHLCDFVPRPYKVWYLYPRIRGFTNWVPLWYIIVIKIIIFLMIVDICISMYPCIDITFASRSSWFILNCLYLKNYFELLWLKIFSSHLLSSK